jgi:hypothetical protein
MTFLKCFYASITVLILSIIQLPAQVLFTDGFESYVGGGAPLDKNYTGTISPNNAAPNGSGNPWFGPAPPNARVVGTDSINGPTVSPHSGNQMIRGSAPSDLDENWYNLAYRLNGGNPYTGNVQLDWWFYDPLGSSGGSSFRDFAALGYYNTAPTTTDYPGTGSLNGSTQIQRLGLGAPYNGSAGYDGTMYQARVVGATDGYSGSTYFNTSTSRSIGWHEGRIVVGPALGNGTANVDFYIDDMVNPTFSHNSVTAWGFNVLEMNTYYGATTGYFDDVSFSVIPEPGSAVLLLCGGLSWLALRRRK